MRHRVRLFALALSLSVAACVWGQTKLPCTKPLPASEKANFRFAVVADRTGGHRVGVFKGALRKVELLGPAFVMSVGDLIEGYTEDQVKIDRQWAEFNAMVRELEMPFFYVAGNHDVSNWTMTRDWRRRFGPSWYHFVYGDVLFLCLNGNLFQNRLHSGPGSASQQVAWIAKTLKANRQVRWTMVFLHQPIWKMKVDRSDWEKVEAMLADRPYTVFAGHYHRYEKVVRGGRDYFVLATTGGGSKLRGRGMGEFDHIVWVTMKAGKPVVTNVMLDGLVGDDPVTSSQPACSMSR